MSFADSLNNRRASNRRSFLPPEEQGFEDLAKLRQERLEREKEAVRDQVVRNIVGKNLELTKKKRQQPGDRFSFLSNQPVEEDDTEVMVSSRQLDLIDSDQLNERTRLIQERNQGIQEVSQEIGFVRQIMEDLSRLTHQQGHLVDNIEEHLGKSATQSEQARTELVKAEKHQKKHRKLLCWASLGGLGVATTAAVLIGLGARKII